MWKCQVAELLGWWKVFRIDGNVGWLMTDSYIFLPSLGKYVPGRYQETARWWEDDCSSSQQRWRLNIQTHRKFYGLPKVSKNMSWIRVQKKSPNLTGRRNVKLGKSRMQEYGFNFFYHLRSNKRWYRTNMVRLASKMAIVCSSDIFQMAKERKTATWAVFKGRKLRKKWTVSPERPTLTTFSYYRSFASMISIQLFKNGLERAHSYWLIVLTSNIWTWLNINTQAMMLDALSFPLSLAWNLRGKICPRFS